MKENTNKAIAINTAVLYAKMGITTVCALLTTRYALQALGNIDFGLYSVLGGIISFIAIFNTIMLSTSNRFIAVSIGKGNIKDANLQFNVCLAVHIVIALCTLLIAMPIGEWYISRYVNYEGDIYNAQMVFNISIIGSVISFIGVPFNGLLMAKEKFIVFSSVEVLAHIFKLIIAYLLLDYFSNKLQVYTICLASLTALPTFVYWMICHIKFPDVVRFKFVTDVKRYKEVLGFSAWVSVGAITFVCRSQGAALLVNAFFNTVLNTALGIANSINGYIALFAQNVTQPMAPQIMKNYANGNINRVNELLVMSTKFAFLMMLVISTPFLVAPEAIIKLWLGEIPPYVISFTVLLIVDNLVQSLNSGISNVIFASGKIKWYQMAVSILNIMAIVVAYVALAFGYQAYYLLIAYILVSFIKFFIMQLILYKTLRFDNKLLIMNSYLPSLLVTILFLPILLLRGMINPFFLIILSFVYVCVIVLFVGMNNKERNYIVSALNKIKNRKNE